jgi:tetratricopeptide (TPR) repeat protein
MRLVKTYLNLFCLALSMQPILASFWCFPTSAAEQSNWSTFFAEGENDLSRERLAEAEECFRKALKEVQLIPHRTDDEVQCLNRLADTLALRSNTAEAQTLYQRALSLLETRYGKDSPKVVPALFALGSMCESEGDPTTAMSLYQRALRINEKHYGPYSPAVANSLHRLGRASYGAGHKDQAAKHYKTAMSILMQQPGLAASKQMQSLLSDYQDLISKNDQSKKDLISDFRKDILPACDNPDKLGAGISLPTEQKTAGTTSVKPIDTELELPRLRPAPAGSEAPAEMPQPDTRDATRITAPSPAPGAQLNFEPATPQPANNDSQSSATAWGKQISIQLDTARESQTIEAPQVLGRGLGQPFTQPELSPAYNVMQNVISKQNHYQESEASYQRKIAIDIKALGQSHPCVANDLNSLALLYIAQHRCKEAEPLLMRAVKIYQDTYGDHSAVFINTQATLASVEYCLGNIELAAQLYRSALGNGVETISPHNFETARILNELAFLYYQQGKLQDSATFYEWALASTRDAVGEKAPLLAACMKDYAKLLRSLGRSTDAAAMEARADSILAQR